MKTIFTMNYGLPSASFRFAGRHIQITYAGNPPDRSWFGYYSHYGVETPWRHWFMNPIYDNRSFYTRNGHLCIYVIILKHIVYIE